MIDGEGFGYRVGAQFAKLNPEAMLDDEATLIQFASLFREGLHRAGYAQSLLYPAVSFDRNFCTGFQVVRWTQEVK